MIGKKYARAYIEITNICNRNCSFCPGTKRVPRRMELQEFKQILDSIKGVTEYIYLHVMGEPLTHPRLAEFIEAASSAGFKCAITTNGTLLPTRGENLIGVGTYKVNISLHSFEDGNAEEYLSYIDGCINFADRASRSGILTVLRLWNRGYDEGRNINTLELIEKHFTTDEWVWGTRGARIRDKLHLEYGDRFEWPDMLAAERGERVFCHGLGDHFAVLVDGSVVPCCLDRDGVMTLGNIFEEKIADILTSDRAMKIAEGFRNKRAEEELCRRCGYARRFKV